MLRRYTHFAWIALLITGWFAALGIHQRDTFAASTLSEVGAAQIAGAVQLDVAVSPTVAQPGDTVQLTLTLSNPGHATQMPEIELQLPSNLALPLSTALPAGMSINLASNELNWLPVLVANESQQQFVLPLRVESADVANPDQAITAVIQLNDQEYTATASFWVGIAPQIEAILSPPQVAVGQSFQLGVETSGSGPFSQAWQLGDGRRVDVDNPMMVYSTAGIYEIEVAIENPLTAVSATKSITVVPQPAAQFSADDFTLTSNVPIQFINQSGGQPPLVYRWDFGDGRIEVGDNPLHQYNAPGVYQVRLEVENEYGRSEAYQTITISEPPTVADFIMPESVEAGQTLSAQAFGDESVTLYQWDMGDGNQAEGVHIQHSYQQSGDYYVTMTAVNAYGSNAVGRWIHVESGFFTTFLPMIINQLASHVGIVDGEDEIISQLPEITLDEPFQMRIVPLPADMLPVEQLYFYINQARTRFDLPPLTRVHELNLIAQQHTNDMAQFAYTAHVGSDGSYPVERFIQFQYPRGYAGEATAWGFEHPAQAVEFWVNSPAHRRIILNEFATDVGVGYTVSFGAPNVWYWTAEFGNTYLLPTQAGIRLRSPQPDQEFLNSELITFGWNWPLHLTDEQEFVVSLTIDRDETIVGTVVEPSLGTYYALETDLLQLDVDELGETAVIQIQLRQGQAIFAESEQYAINILLDPTLPTPTPDVTFVPPSPTPPPTVTPTVPNILPTSTPPINPPPPPLVTTTPNP